MITHLSEQISTLNERMDDFTSRIEELTSKFSEKRVPSHQNIAGQTEPCNGSATSLFMAGLGNGQMLPNSASSNQLARDPPLMEEVDNSYFLTTFHLSFGSDMIFFLLKRF